jgi:DNA-binding LytR/AlgR family response regulator
MLHLINGIGMKMNCIAIDDESLALSKIKRFAEKIEYINLVECFDNALDSIYFIKENNIQLIFLDIQMKDFTGIQLIEALHSPPQIILTTAYDQYALKGYELDVTDYLLKPIQFDRFLKACEKAYSIFQNKYKLLSLTNEVATSPKKDEFIFVKTGSTSVKVKLMDILYIEGMKDYLSVYTTHGRIVTLQTFESIKSILPVEEFIRVHRSYLVPKKRIEKIHKNDIEIAGKLIPIGRTYKSQFIEAIYSKGLNNDR